MFSTWHLISASPSTNEGVVRTDSCPMFTKCHCVDIGMRVPQPVTLPWFWSWHQIGVSWAYTSFVTEHLKECVFFFIYLYPYFCVFLLSSFCSSPALLPSPALSHVAFDLKKRNVIVYTSDTFLGLVRSYLASHQWMSGGCLRRSPMWSEHKVKWAISRVGTRRATMLELRQH